MASGGIITNILLNKWVIIALVVFLIYTSGGFGIFFKNPIIFVFIVLGIIVVKTMGEK